MAVTQDPERSVRMARPARRAQLLSAAQEVFVVQGYHAAAMDDIAERAGVSKPVLYQHFPGKLDLYLALLDASSEEIVAALRCALSSTKDNRQRVTAAITAYFEFVDSSAETFRLLFESDLVNDAEVRGRVERTDDRCAKLLAAVISGDTGLGLEESTLLASGLIGLAQTSARAWLRGGEDRLPRQRAEALVAALGWRGISGFPRTPDEA